ncbi:DUF2637 domain-containing protein [Actinoplanes sp. CA-030573]|uniref:DUF2637 domain-containing protein n=1 Tax=Actinoplanes sp. CA-030573 TaxID=3239898 RepID=UPI003D8B21BD
MVVLQHLRRVRWAVRATLFLGVAASVVANVLHALDNPISQAIAAWPPLALLLTVELISRVPVHRRWLAATRLLATATIAGIAAWVSYWHMAGVAARYGETGASPYLLPLSVDGLIVVASICLVELGGRIATLEHTAEAPVPATPDATATAVPATAVAANVRPAATAAPDTVRPAATAAPAAVRPAATGPAAGPATAFDHAAPVESTIPDLIPTPMPVRSVPAPAAGRNAPMDHRARAQIAAALSRTTESAKPVPATAAARSVPAQRGTAASRAATSKVSAASRAATSKVSAPSRAATSKVSAPPQTATSKVSGPSPAATGKATAASVGTAKPRRTPAETVALANQIKAERPSLTEAEIAAELGITASRWRAVRREATQAA